MNHKARVSLFLSSFVLIICSIISSCSGVGDDSAPARITNFNFDPATRQFTWTATGDDGNSGRATVYDIRFSTIQETVQDNFSDATQILSEPEPNNAGTPQSFLVPRLDITEESRFFFAINVRDEVGNNSGPSNVVEVRTPLAPAEFRDSTDAGCFGEAVSSGDFNDDDIDDVVIGDPCLGMVYIFFGRNDFTIGSSDGDGIFDIGSGDTADVTIIGSNNPDDMFGASLAGVGNIDGDISDDLAIGAPGFDGGTGQVLVILGGRNIPSNVDLTNGDNPAFIITGESVGDSFGSTVIRRGSNTIFVGAPNAASGSAGSRPGKAYLFRGGDLGSVTPANDARTIIIGEDPGDMFGFAIAEAGQIDNNSSNDFAISSPGAGKVYVFLEEESGTKDLSVDTSDVVTIQDPAEGFGSSIAGGGNVVGIVMDDEQVDDRDDLLIGAPGSNMNTGSVFLYSGDDIASAETTGVSPNAKTEFAGLNPGDRFGTSIAVPGDLNPVIDKSEESEGIIIDFIPTNADFVVGASGTVDGTGTVYLFFGRNEFPASVSADESDIPPLEGSTPADEFGRLLVNLGNLTDDTTSDLEFKNDFAIGGLGFIRVEF